MVLKFDHKHPKYEYITDKARAQSALEELQAEPVLAVDTEANSLDPYVGLLILVQISTPVKTYVFDVRSINLGEYELFQSLMADPKKIKLFHNAKFDYKYLKQNYNVELKNIYDTYLAERTLTAGTHLKVGLGETVSRRVEEGILDKSEQLEWIHVSKTTRLREEQLKYAARDVLFLFPVMEAQLPLLTKEGVINTAKLEFGVTTAVGDMELAGVYINKEKWLKTIGLLRIKRDELAGQFQNLSRQYYKTSQTDLFGNQLDVLNINSQLQLLDLFNNKLGLGLPSTGSEILERYGHPLVTLLNEYRGFEKLISSFGDSILEKINKKTGRVHPEFLQFQADTGRFACANPNLQQIPRMATGVDFRSSINPMPGNKLVVSDYSSFEMRILAELSGDEKLIEAVSGTDVHSFTAAMMFGKPFTPDFKKLYPELRQMAKPIGFGLMYGMGPMGLITRIRQETKKEITPKESEELISKYFMAYPKVKTFLEQMAKKAIQNGWSSTPGGRKRWYTRPDKNDPDYRKKLSSIERQAKNHPIQGTNADAIKYALVFVKERFKKEHIDGVPIMCVHDEIVCEVKEAHAEAAAKILSEEMVRAGALFLKKVPVKSDPFVGDVWEH